MPWWLCGDIAGLTGYRLPGHGGLTGGTAVMGRFGMGGAVAANRLITVGLGDAELEVEAVPVAGIEATSGPDCGDCRDRAGGFQPGAGRDNRRRE